ncbi:MMPL family transporter [Nevskia sp.]|uniref:efflux RND transporter permease subunit n=1 Tax=Nevskia sp. TaxID=1929292 RepID=UPI0025D8A0C0|nr:MMPL family transporter [Nevskia sp.]
MKRLSYGRLLKALLDRRKAVLIVAAALTVLICLGLPYPRIHIELDTMLPEESEITQVIRASQMLFGPTDYIVIGISHEVGAALDAAGAQQLARVQDQLISLPGVRSSDVISLLSTRARVVTAEGGDVQIAHILRDASDWPGATERVRRSSLYRSLLSADGRSTLILFRISEPPEGKRAYLKSLRKQMDAITAPGFRIVIGGQPSVFAELERYSQNIFLVLPFTLLLIGLIHFEAFRSMQGMVFPLVTAVASAGVATAVMTQFGVRLDGFNTTAPIVIVALTAGHAVQMLKRFNEELVAVAAEMPGADWPAINRAAIERAFVAVAPVMVAASLVAAASFASLAIFKTPVIRSFGLYAALGIMAGLAIELLFIPALRLASPARQLPVAEQRHSMWDRIVERLASSSRSSRNRRWTVAISAAALGICGVLAANVKIDNSVEEYFASFTDIRKTERELNQRYAGSSVLYLLFRAKGENALATADVANLLRRIEARLLERPEIGTAVSFADAPAEVACGFEQTYCKPGALDWTTEALRQFLALYESGAGADALDDFVTPTREAALIRVLSKTDSSIFIDRLFKELHAEFDAQLPAGVSMILGGTGATTLALNQKFIEAKLANIAQILGIAALVATVLFRSLLMGLLIAVPLFAATVFAFAVMTVAGIPLNVATVFIAAISVGIGADYAIYFGVRLRDFLRSGDGDVATALAATYRTAGKAALFVASAVAGGYLGLVASIGYNVHLWLGVMVSTAMLASVVASLTLFPALLLMLKPRAVFGQLRS